MRVRSHLLTYLVCKFGPGDKLVELATKIEVEVRVVHVPSIIRIKRPNRGLLVFASQLLQCSRRLRIMTSVPGTLPSESFPAPATVSQSSSDPEALLVDDEFQFQLVYFRVSPVRYSIRN